MRPTDRELQWWARLWATPQADQWERLHLDIEVALYVRRLGEAELPGASAALSTLVRQMAESLGLTVVGMLRLRWHLGRAAVGTPPAEDVDPEEPKGQPSSRTRFHIVQGGSGVGA